ncbi:probable inorganic phosphate transporter 1-12 isoform X2 [Panicum virgatum]|uniref:probable inorganic phosphate transporter 1-12 isoform X2 n=1 Tax=Panicum virgatum TaxID=38727 RepID=UPI0019D63C37|nr:probable inorganic phosphate transporter 1-12 isoform X2 [Panicum virgatum]
MASEKLQVLHALDVARTQRYHVRAVVIAGTGFFADAYDLFCITLVTKLLGRIYFHAPGRGEPGRLPPRLEAAIGGATFCGMVAGQLLFGWLGDRAGRKRFYGTTVLLMAAGSFLSGLSFGNSAGGVMATLCFFRFWLGVGVGGDYPLSATIVSEYAGKRTRGALVAAVFAMEGFGILAGCIVTLVVSAAFQARSGAPAFEEDPAASTPPLADYVWRIVLMAGAVPACLTYRWRARMPETARYTALVARDAARAARDMSRVLEVDIAGEPDKVESLTRGRDYGVLSRRFARRHGLHLLGAAASWFVLGVFYSQNILQGEIFSDVGWVPRAHAMSALEEAYRVGRAQAIIALCGALPGYWFAVAFVDVAGRKAIQFLGFAMMTGFMLAIAALYDGLAIPGRRVWLVAMYTFTFFFANFGPNSTTFIVPAEIFPAHLRATCHGMSAAAGKAGAIVGTFGFMYTGYPSGIGVRASLFVLAASNVLGILFTCLLPEPKGRSLEEVSGDGGDSLNSDETDVGDS